MNVPAWQRRIERAEELARKHPFAREMLGYYAHVARYQQDLYRQLAKAIPRDSRSSFHGELSADELEILSSRFESFLSVAEAHGPKGLAELSQEWRIRGKSSWSEFLQGAWIACTFSDAQSLLTLAFLQPFAELLRSRVSLRPASTAYALCPFCNRKPGFGVLRQMGDGGARFMICSFCLAEWEFRRIVCAGCGEEDEKKLPVFTASEFDYIRVECCDACKTYIKSIDLTKNGRAEPLVDELASAPLDLWAQEHGYAKLQTNLMGM